MCNVRALDPAISDHCAVYREVFCLIKMSFERRTVTYRNLSSLDRNLFVQDMMSSTVLNHNFTDVSVFTDCYTNTLQSLLDKYAPAKSRVITMRLAASWYSDHIRSEKTKGKRCKWRRDKLMIHREIMLNIVLVLTNLYKTPRCSFMPISLMKMPTTSVLFLSVGKMLNLKADRKLLSH